ncbi:MAG: DUF2281 domain-containing protein [Chloroherpetonaceae bacterium]|nr:DUF2281 domain-containing protein [Chloroherpetonaceae bacterium]
MDILEEIVAKARTLSPERQREALDFIEFLAKKESNENANAPEPSEWRWNELTANDVPQLRQSVKEQKEELRRLWLETD